MSDDLISKSTELETSKEITNRLLRMKGYLIKDLERISMAEKILVRDKEILTKTKSLHSDYEDKTTKGLGIVKSIDRKQRKAKILADLGFVILCCTLMYLVFKRVPPTLIDSVVLVIQTTYQTMSSAMNGVDEEIDREL